MQGRAEDKSNHTGIDRTCKLSTAPEKGWQRWRTDRGEMRIIVYNAKERKEFHHTLRRELSQPLPYRPGGPPKLAPMLCRRAASCGYFC